MGVVGGPLGLDFDHLGVPGRSLGSNFDNFRAPREASGAKICNFVIEHLNFLEKRKTAATWSRPAEILRSKYSFLSTPIAFFKQKLWKVNPSTRGSKCQNAEPPCAGSNRVSSNTLLQGVLTTRPAFMVRSASGYRGHLRFLGGCVLRVIVGIVRGALGLCVKHLDRIWHLASQVCVMSRYGRENLVSGSGSDWPGN